MQLIVVTFHQDFVASIHSMHTYFFHGHTDGGQIYWPGHSGETGETRLSHHKHMRISDHLSSGLYYKHMTIINYASNVIKKLGASLTDDARVIIYDCYVFIVLVFIVQATEA
jgi:hypothetical protein